MAWGIERGDRVAILSENRWEWAVTDFAVLAVGGVDVPLYPTLTGEQVGYMLRDSGAKVAVVSSREQYAKLRQAGELPELRQVVVMDAGAVDGGGVGGSAAGAAVAGTLGFATCEFAALMATAETKQTRDAAFDALVRRARPEDPMTIIYTSGTTGEPKGVVLTHGNLASNLRYSTAPLGITEKDSCISFLPLSHVDGAASGLCADAAWREAGVLRQVRASAAGDAGGAANDLCGGAAGVREDSADGGGAVGGVAGEVADAGVGAGGGAAGIGRRRLRARSLVG